MLDVEDEVTDEIVNALASIEGVIRVRKVK